MQHTGTLFLSRTRPHTTNQSNEFALTLLAFDAISNRRREPWRLCWRGEQAQAWWEQNQNALTPGRPLHVICERAQVIATKSSPPVTEIQAEVIALQLTQTGNQS